MSIAPYAEHIEDYGWRESDTEHPTFSHATTRPGDKFLYELEDTDLFVFINPRRLKVSTWL